MKAKEFCNRWDKFFFQEAPVEGLALFRVLIGSLALVTFLQDSLIMNDLWGPMALQTTETMLKNYSFPIMSIFQFLKLTPTLLYGLVGLQILSLFTFTLGYKTRLSNWLAFILMVSFNQRNINILSSADLLIRIMFFLMLFSPSGNAYSIDSIIARLKGKMLPRDCSRWPLRLIQMQIAVVYVSTVIAKAKGITWLDGSAVYYATRSSDLTRFPVPFILDQFWTVKLITWSTLVIELALGTVIFFDEIRKKVIILGVIFHLGIEYMMSIPQFEWLMIICLMAMFKIEDYRFFDNQLKNWLKNILIIKKNKILQRSLGLQE